MEANEGLEFEVILLLSNSESTTVVDEIDFIFCSLLCPWHISRGYVKRTKNEYLHKVIAKRMGLVGEEIDHKDRNRLNNQRENLRVATHADNTRNKSKKENVTSIYKGVYYDSRDKVWRAQIVHNYKKIALGSFRNEVEAALAYNDAAIKVFGAFANLNVIK